ncbi:MAG: hypothetical protein CMP60_00170 [Flavobacteriales bacterium]|nr:hypothetical protein [Flavobacteriales bacterium]
MNNIKIFLTSMIIMSCLGCGLEKMASDYNKVVYEQTPTIPEVHGGQLSVDLKGTFPEKYFAKKAIVEITPVIIDENGVESKLKSITLQGEQATGGDATIFFESGGEFTYSDKIRYTDEMLNSTLELRALATLEDDNKVLGPVTIASGVITTSMRVQNDEIVAVADHGYKEVETVSETATIYFLVNKSNIRTTEKSDDDVKKLQDFIKQGYKTESFVVKSSASPEGTEKINSELSDDRQNSTLTYAKYLLKKLQADGSAEDDNYNLSSTGADWNGFNKLVEKSTIDEKSTILSLSNRNKEKTQKERGELLQDMAQVYDALEGDVLQYLRKSEITINSYLPKKTREEIVLLSLTDPSDLSVEELLYSATLEENKSNLIDIYNNVIELHNDWRAYNNIACIYLLEMDKENAIDYLNQAIENGGANNPDVLNNLGIVASWDGDLVKAEEFFNKANASNHNKAILSIKKGDYRSASRYYRGQETYNATLATILNGDNNSACTQNTAQCYYLNAIAGARLGNENRVFTNLEKAINSNSDYKNQAEKDLEFLNYRENEKFISLTK